MTLCKIEFNNNNCIGAKDFMLHFSVEKRAIPHILSWYGAFHAGDEYTVTIDDVEAKLDINGELIEEVL